jgi:hypothetical protein
MAKYAEGNRANPATTNTVISSSQHNGAEDQLAAMLGPRVLNLMSASPDTFGTGWNITRTAGGGGTHTWQNSTDNSAYLWLDFSLYTGQKITSVEVVVSGATGATGGNLRFGYVSEGGNSVVTDMTGGESDPWDTGGAAYGSATPYTLTTSPLPLTITSGMEVYFELRAASNATTYTNYIWAARATVQFGN